MNEEIKGVFDIEALLEKSKNLTDAEKQKFADAISKALKESAKTIAELRKAMEIDPKVLHDEFTL
ncbi:MAG: hypothetical protein K8S87_08690 [Planctomycetes bacterium]|nr:hypothetical protein [Planctomycetota bacterium]